MNDSANLSLWPFLIHGDDGLLDLVLASDVAATKHDAIAEQHLNFVARFLVVIEYGHVGSPAHEFVDGRESEAGAAAGDKEDVVLDEHRVGAGVRGGRKEVGGWEEYAGKTGERRS
jgi:hypothetical protein